MVPTPPMWAIQKVTAMRGGGVMRGFLSVDYSSLTEPVPSVTLEFRSGLFFKCYDVLTLPLARTCYRCQRKENSSLLPISVFSACKVRLKTPQFCREMAAQLNNDLPCTFLFLFLCCFIIRPQTTSNPIP